MTETFAVDWLALREPHDHVARRGVADGLLARLAAGGSCRVVDLGAGSGSNLRFLHTRLGVGQTWRLIDADATLVQAVAAPPGAAVTALVADLAAIGADHLADADLVTATAFLDLVSADWLARFVGFLTGPAGGPAVLIALTYDGRIEWTPADPDDAFVRDAVNRHQRTDKGFGAALGPDAAAALAAALAGVGYRVETADTPWRLGGDDAAIQRALLDGYVGAAVKLEPGQTDRIAAWADRRRALIGDGLSRLLVGHTDVFADPLGAPFAAGGPRGQIPKPAAMPAGSRQ